MADYFLSLFCHLIIDVILMCFQLLNLLVRDVQSQLFSVSASAIQSLLQVLNFMSGEKTYCISLLAYRSESGLTYLSVLICFSPFQRFLSNVSAF